MPTFRHAAPWALALLLPVVLLASCKRRSEPAKSGGAKDTLSVVMIEPRSLDPARIADAMGRQLAEDLFEGLVARDARGQPVPALAASWTTSSDLLTWTFTLREGLVWSDDTPLTSADIVWSLRRALLPETQNHQAQTLWVLRGGRALAEGKAGPDAPLGVSAPDPKTVVLTLERPTPDLLHVLSTAYACPTPRHVIDKHGAAWTRPEHLVSNGPFVLRAHEAERRMTLERNPRYWDKEHPPALARVEVRFTTDVKSAEQWFELGEVDWSVSLLSFEGVEALRKRNAPELSIHDLDGVFYLVPNTTKAPFDDVRVRRAFDLALDRGKLTRQVLNGGEKPAESFVPPGLTTARPPRRVRHDPVKARALLAEAGFGKDRPFPKVELLYNTNDKMRRLAEFFQRELTDALGITVQATNVEWKTFLERVDSGDFQLATLNLSGVSNPIDFTDMLLSSSTDNRPRWKSSDYDALAEKVRTAATREARDVAVAALLELADREVPILSVYHPTRQALLRPGLAGYEPNGESVHRLRWLSWRP